MRFGLLLEVSADCSELNDLQLTLCALKPSIMILMQTRAFSSFSDFINLIMSSMTVFSQTLNGSLWGSRWRNDSNVCR